MRSQFILLLLFATVTLRSCEAHKKHNKKNQKPITSERNYEEADDVIVGTNHGQLRGRIDKTKSGTAFYSFQGIPYAQPPLKKLRFEPPKPTNWKGVWNATHIRNNCTQLNTAAEDLANGILGDEDCLYLNIYTDELPTEEFKVKRSVLVFIHGGTFLFGAGELPIHNSGPFIDQKLVVVNINYRLGVFGFLSTGDKVVPGNMGVKDAILALRWVKENIEYFGGNSKNVTIMGESAGAVLVSYLIETPLAKGFFHQAIMESGNTYVAWGSTRVARESTLALGKKLGVLNKNMTEIVRELKALPAKELYGYSTSVMLEFLMKDPLNGLVYSPCLEPHSETAALSVKSYIQLESCNINSVPIIIGFNNAEARFFKLGDVLPLRLFLAKLDIKPEYITPLDIQAAGKCFTGEVGRKIKDYYAGPLGTFVFSPEKFEKYVTDYFFAVPTLEYVKLYGKCNPNVYLYLFSYTGGRSDGAGHTEELNYLFDTNYWNKTKQDIKVSKDMNKLWSNFIKTGNPTPNKIDFGLTWSLSSESNDYTYLNIDSKLFLANQSQSSFNKDIAFWNDLYKICGNHH